MNGTHAGTAPARSAERMRPSLGTWVAMRAEVPGDAAEAALEAAFAVVDAVHREMSFHRPESALSRLNRDACRSPAPCPRGLYRVLRAALALARASDGAFDPTVAARLVASGHLPRPPDAPDADPDADWRDVALRDGRVRFRRPLWLDLGGIAKGHAVDRAVQALQAHGARAGAVNAGGDLRVFGAAPHTVHVRDPRDPQRTRPLAALHDGAAATSAGYFSTRDGLTALVDMRSDARLARGGSATVCAPRALWADALTKVVLADPDRAARLLPRLRASAALIDDNGAMRTLP